MSATITRIFGIDCGHRVTRHESKCRHPHGHRYTFEVTITADALDEMGRVIDFGVVKALIGAWLDDNLDHGYIACSLDGVGDALRAQGFKVFTMPGTEEPTAENLAMLVLAQAQALLAGRPLRVVHVRCYETPNCWADAVAT